MVSSSALFDPIKLGNLELQHRVVLAPMARFRADENGVPTEMMREYYSQRATPRGLLLTEATTISKIGGSYPRNPEIITQEQVEGWKRVTQAVHAKGGYIFLQILHVGRSTESSLIGGHQPVSSSAIPSEGLSIFTGKPYEVPRPLTMDEIQDIVADHVQAARNGVEAGFDGVEIHSAHGFLLDQFINSNSNRRTDAYGGPIENRTRFVLETIRAVVDAIGAERVGVRFSPGAANFGVADDTPYDTWGHIMRELQAKLPNLAYVHLIEPREDFTRKPGNDTVNSLDPFRKLWKGPIISAGFTSNISLAGKVANETGNLISFGRAYAANPDLYERLRQGLPLNKYDRSTFYTHGPEGYIDYPFLR